VTFEPVRPLPAATLVPLRDGHSGLEVLLLLRSERSSFAPGRFVFPGGVVDDADASVEAIALVNGLTEVQAAERLGIRGAHPLVGVRDTAGAVPPYADQGVAALRSEVLAGRIGFTQALRRLGAQIAGSELTYIAHWITPELSPRRYDTRFFAARVETDRSGHQPVLDEREMTEALWTTPASALRAQEAGSMKMILPTIETLRQLASFPDARAALSALGRAVIATNLPTADSPGAVTKDFAAPPARDRLG
jgi:hypothetical protein